MGLIKKTIGCDLKTKIEVWLNKTNLWIRCLNITNDLKLLVPNDTREIVIQAILYLLEGEESQELPEYIMFDFSLCDYCSQIYYYGCFDDALQLLNRADKHLFGINKCRIICRGSEHGLYDLKRINDEWCCIKKVIL